MNVTRGWGFVLVVAAAAGLGGCKKKISSDKAEDLVRGLFKRNDVAVDKVSCPKDLKVKKGDIFMCDVTAAGLSFQVEMRQKDDKGYTEAFAKGVAMPQVVAKQLTETARKKVGPEATVDCGPEKIRLAASGAKWSCMGSLGGQQHPIEIEMTDDYGSWKAND